MLFNMIFQLCNFVYKKMLIGLILNYQHNVYSVSFTIYASDSFLKIMSKRRGVRT